MNRRPVPQLPDDPTRKLRAEARRIPGTPAPQTRQNGAAR